MSVEQSAAQAFSAYAIPDEGNEALKKLMDQVAWPKGWGWYRAALKGFAAQVELAHVPGMERARLSFAHRDVTLPSFAGAPRVGPFSLLVQAAEGAPDVPALEQALAEAFGTFGLEFPWVKVVEATGADPTGDTHDVDDPPPPEEGSEEEHLPGATADASDEIPAAAPADDAIAALLALAGVMPGTVKPEMALETELDLHLEVRPFLDVGIRFDPEKMLAEARALLPRYVAYQSDASFGIEHWNGLALWGFDGDERQPAMPVGDGANDGARYKATAAATECPATMAFLAEHLDLSRARTIAFLALKPHSEITAHTDDDMHEVTHSLNVALNMPKGCEFLLELGDDGKPGPRTITLPLEAGTALFVNVGKMHKVVNNSDELRIHLVARAPLKRPIEEVVALARAQTGLRTPDELEAAVAGVYVTHGWPPPGPLAPGLRRKRHGT